MGENSSEHRRPYNPDEFPLGMLINHLAKFFKDYQRIEGEKRGIRNSYRPICFQLRHQCGLSQYELAKRCQVRPSSMSVTLRNMEEEGYILRKPDEKDQRLIRVYLTEQGMELDDQIRELIHQTEGVLGSALDEVEIKQLKGLLAKIYNHTIGKDEATNEKTS